MPRHCSGGGESARALTQRTKMHRMRWGGGGASPDRRKDGLDEARQLAQVTVGLEQSQDTGVGSCVPEPGDRTLDQGPAGALVEARDAAFGVEGLGGCGERGAMTILIVHDGSNPL